MSTEPNKPTKPNTSIEPNKVLVRRFYDEVLNANRVDLIDELATADYEEHDPLPGQRDGSDGLKDRVTMLHDGMTGRYTVEDVIAEGDRVVVRWSNIAMHAGTFLGIPPTGRTCAFPGIDIYRLANGRMAEHWHVVDQLAMLQQLGLIPSPEGAPA
jgi:predicted ester cyclase